MEKLPSQALHEFLRSRRSVREFQPRPVPDDVLERILDTGIYAPSAHNLQPWRIVVLRKPEVKRKLALALTERMRRDMAAEGADAEAIEARVARSIRRMDEAPVVLLLNRDVDVVRRDAPPEHTMAVQSVAALALQLMLAAHAEGLGSVWVCWPLYAQAETRAALALPASWEPQGMLFIGYPAESPEPPPRLPRNAVVWEVGE